MWFSDFFTSRRSQSRRTQPNRKRACLLIFEQLEERALPGFLAPVSYAVDSSSSAPTAVAVGDFNGDGKLDLVTANSYSNSFWASGSVSVLLGNGDGTYQPARNFATGTGNYTFPSVAVGDFNSDGKLDIVETNDSGVSVLLGNGDGTFQPARNLALPLGQGPQSVAVGDLNGDGKLDLVVTGTTSYFGPYAYATPPGANYVNVLMGNGDGTFSDASTVQIPSGSELQPVALGDFNSDGKLDVATTATTGVALLLNNGNGTLAPPTTFATGGSAESVVVGDFNGDGKLDLVTGNYSSGVGSTMSILLGNGDGTFQPARNLASNIGPVFGAGDFNRDGKFDIVSENANGGLSVFLGNGDGTFQSPQNYDPGLYPSAVAVGDLSGDGFPDLAVAGPGGTSTVSVILNAADWSAPQASSFAVNGFPSPTTAGTAGAFTVTVKYADGATDANFNGTVLFTSSDPRAVLPAAYTFTAADAGVHTFSATLYTAGTQSITATDYTTGLVSGTDDGIIVNPAAASTLSVAGFPSPAIAGVAGNFTVTARDAYGNIATGYSGTVHFTSSDGKASLPANYTFTASDAGVHTFSATLKTAGTQSITATDTATANIIGTDAGIAVNPAAAFQFVITAPTNVTAGASFSLMVKVEDAYGNIVTNFTGTIHFSSTDPRAKLPANYTFTAADHGVHTFKGLVLRTKGKQTITIADTLNSALTDNVVI